MRLRPLWSLAIIVGLPGVSAFSLGRPAAALGDAFQTEIELTTRGIGAGEVALGDLVADSIRASAKADLSFVPAAAFTQAPVVIKVGGFTAGEILKAMDYEKETIALCRLTGVQIRAALERGLHLFPKSNSSFLQTSGLTVDVDPNPDSRNRVRAVKVHGDPLAPARVYYVAMPLTLANGALAYAQVWKKTDLEKDTGTTLESAIDRYLADHSIIRKGEERLVAHNRQ